jgi:hypothetical protein
MSEDTATRVRRLTEHQDRWMDIGSRFVLAYNGAYVLGQPRVVDPHADPPAKKRGGTKKGKHGGSTATQKVIFPHAGEGHDDDTEVDEVIRLLILQASLLHVLLLNVYYTDAISGAQFVSHCCGAAPRSLGYDR